MAVLDIVIPVYNEGPNILNVLLALERDVKTPCKVFLCYDLEDDNTLAAVRESWRGSLDIAFVRNRSRGPHAAVLSGFDAGSNPFVLSFMADDDLNAGIVDAMVSRAREGCRLVAASRFIKGGSMINCPPLKAALVRTASFTLCHLARLPAHDATNGFRLFSRELIERVAIESTHGFTYSLELLAKCHRLGWPIGEVPAQWMERTHGQSRFRILKWLPHYLRWYAYAFATTYLHRGPQTIPTPANGRVRPQVSPVA